MKRLVFITLTAIFWAGQNPVYAFYQQEIETVQSEITKLSEEELQDDNSENFQTQPQATEIEEEVQPIIQETETSSNSETYSDNEKTITFNNKQNENLSLLLRAIEQIKHSFPTWGWFVIIGIAVLAFAVYQYKKYLSMQYSYNLFSVSIIVCLLVLFGGISILFYMNEQSETGEMWGISMDVFRILLTTAFVLTIAGLYWYNFKKTNWHFAIINVIIQTIAVAVFAIIVIGWIILKLLSVKDVQSSTSSNSSNGRSSSSSSNSPYKENSLSRTYQTQVSSSINSNSSTGGCSQINASSSKESSSSNSSSTVQSKSKCKFCGLSSYGRGCTFSSTHIHEHSGTDGKKCVYSGSPSYGYGCTFSPNRKHKHEPGHGKCIYCGLKRPGHGCTFSPSGTHEF